MELYTRKNGVYIRWDKSVWVMKYTIPSNIDLQLCMVAESNKLQIKYDGKSKRQFSESRLRVWRRDSKETAIKTKGVCSQRIKYTGVRTCTIQGLAPSSGTHSVNHLKKEHWGGCSKKGRKRAMRLLSLNRAFGGNEKTTHNSSTKTDTETVGYGKECSGIVLGSLCPSEPFPRV